MVPTLNLAHTAGCEGLSRLTSLTQLDVRVSLRSGHDELCGGGALQRREQRTFSNAALDLAKALAELVLAKLFD